MHQAVERVHVCSRARLDHVSRAAFARHHSAVEVHPDRHLADGVLAGGYGAQLIVLEPTLEPGDGVDGVQHRVHRPVAHARVLEDLGVLLETHRGRGDDARPADHVQVVERVRLGHLGDLVLDDGDQVVVEDVLLLVREILEPLGGLAELALVEIEPELSQPRGESGPARVLAHDELVGGPADVFRLHDLVGELFLEHAVLVDARLVGEGVLAHDGLVGLHVHARNGGEEARALEDLLRAHLGVDLEEVLACLERHHDLLEGGLARPLPDAVGGALDLPRPRPDGREGVGHGLAQVVVTVHGEHGLAAVLDVLPDLHDPVEPLLGNGVAHGVRDVDGAGPRVDDRLQHLAHVVEVRAGGVLGRELHVLAVRPRVLDRVDGRLQDLGPALPELVLEVDVRGGHKGMDAGALRVLDRLPRPVDVGEPHPAEPADDGRPLQGAHLLGDLAHRLEILVRGDGEARLDDVDVQAGELPRHLELLLRVHGKPGGLLAVPERRVEDDDPVHHVSSIALVRVPGSLLVDHRLIQAAAHPHGARGTAQQVQREQDEQEPLRMRGHDEHAQDHEDEHLGGAAAREVHFLEAVVAEGRDHEEGDHHRAHADGGGLPAPDLRPFQEQRGGGDDARGGGGGQTHEVAAVRHALVDVEAREPEGAADDEEKGPEPGHAAELLEGEGIEHEGGRDAEGHHVREGVELHAELGGGPGQPCDLAVEDVEDHPHEDGHRRLDEAGLRGEHDGEEAAEAVARGEEAGKQEDAPPRMLAELLPAPAPRMARAVPALMLSPSHRSTPMMVSPPRTLSPTRTLSTAPRGTMRSVREPNRIRPYRSPAWSLSPGRTRHTMRRASTPPIRLTPTRALPPSRATVQPSFSLEASSRYAARKRPSAYWTSRTSPATGERFTCTSRGDRKMDTRVARPTQPSSTSATPITRPSAGARTAPVTAGGVRSGSRKKPRHASAKSARGAAAHHRPIQPRIHAAAAAGTIKRQPSTATGMRTRSPPRYTRGGLIQDIILRSRAPTSSMGCSASRRRWARKPARWAWFSSTHSRANWPDWISPRIFFISALVSSLMIRGPRV